MKLKVFCQWLRIALFSIALLSFCVLGFLTFLRPEISDKEGRRLTEFPTFSAEAFLSGEYTSQINLWNNECLLRNNIFLCSKFIGQLCLHLLLRLRDKMPQHTPIRCHSCCYTYLSVGIFMLVKIHSNRKKQLRKSKIWI